MFLNTLPGDQFAATLWPAPTARPRLRLPSRPLNDPSELRIPIGPTGVLVGAALRDAPDARPPQQRDDLVMWSLTDPQQATRIVMDTSERGDLLRTPATVGVVDPTQHCRRRPPRRSRLRAHHRRQRPAHRAAVGRAVGHRHHAGPRRRWSRTRPALRADLRVHGAGQLAGSHTLDLAIVAFRQEQAWTG
jgi:hypothetical protein